MLTAGQFINGIPNFITNRFEEHYVNAIALQLGDSRSNSIRARNPEREAAELERERGFPDEEAHTSHTARREEHEQCGTDVFSKLYRFKPEHLLVR